MNISYEIVVEIGWGIVPLPGTMDATSPWCELDWSMSVYAEPGCLFFKLFFRYFIHDQVLFNFFPDGFFQTGNSPDILNRIDTVNQDLPVRDNIEIS